MNVYESIKKIMKSQAKSLEVRKLFYSAKIGWVDGEIWREKERISLWLCDFALGINLIHMLTELKGKLWMGYHQHTQWNFFFFCKVSYIHCWDDVDAVHHSFTQFFSHFYRSLWSSAWWINFIPHSITIYV
jgi:hypothetical protein